MRSPKTLDQPQTQQQLPKTQMSTPLGRLLQKHAKISALLFATSDRMHLQIFGNVKLCQYGRMTKKQNRSEI